MLSAVNFAGRYGLRLGDVASSHHWNSIVCCSSSRLSKIHRRHGCDCTMVLLQVPSTFFAFPAASHDGSTRLLDPPRICRWLPLSTLPRTCVDNTARLGFSDGHLVGHAGSSPFNCGAFVRFVERRQSRTIAFGPGSKTNCGPFSRTRLDAVPSGTRPRMATSLVPHPT